jgi:predicted metal-dependent enzyme (double-stranded beta helix superfamily)
MQEESLATWQASVEHALAEATPEVNASSLATLCTTLRELTCQTDIQARLLIRAEQARHAYRRWQVAERDGFSAVLIGWPPGFNTPIHDHDGLWGIELVVYGALHVEEFQLHGGSPGKRRELDLHRSEAAIFDQPDYAHACSNPSHDVPALSLHVYGGKLARYGTYPAEGSSAQSVTAVTTVEKL